MDVVFHVPFTARHEFRFLGADEREPEDWRLPLYPYPPQLSATMRRWLPRCLGLWDKCGPGGEPLVEGLGRIELGAPNVTLWRPKLLLVSQPVTIPTDRPLDEVKADGLLNRVGAWLTGHEGESTRPSPLVPVMDMLFANATERPVSQYLRGNGFDPDPLWAFGTGQPGPHLPQGETELGSLRACAAEFSCFLSYDGLPEPERELKHFMLVMAVQNVVWYRAMENDSSLLEHIEHLHSGRSGMSMRLLEHQGTELLARSFEVARLDGSVASMKTHLAVHAQEYWGFMDAAWHLSEYMDEITRKADAYVTLYDRAVAQRMSLRTRRLANAALVFTAVGGVSFIVALEEFIIDKPGFDWVGAIALALIAFCMIGAGAALWRLMREDDPQSPAGSAS